MIANIFSVLLLFGLASGSTDENNQSYAAKDVNGSFSAEDDTIIQLNNWNYPIHGACIHPICITYCDTEFSSYLLNITDPDKKIPFDWKDIFQYNRSLYKRNEEQCETMQILAKESFNVLENGSLLLQDNTIAEHTCINLVENSSTKLHVFQCMDFYKPAKLKSLLKQALYPPFYILSSFFLILTVLAFAFTTEMKSFHSKCIVCHSACLALAFVGFAVIFREIFTDYKVLCTTTGITTLYSIHASMFWLNSMCIDIFLTFKGAVRTRGSHLVTFAVYSFVSPMVIAIAALVFNFVFEGMSDWNPSFNANKCWFRADRKAWWLLYMAPTTILLVANVALISTTACNVNRMRRESVRTLKKTNSKIHMSRKQAIQRRGLYVKLSLLVGFPWAFEVLYHIIGEDGIFWRFTDIINASRGVIIFLLCVVFNQNIRKFLGDKFLKKPGESVKGSSKTDQSKSATTQI